MSQRLYTHQGYQHRSRNVNEAAREHLGLNDRLAVWISAHVGTMTAAYLFAAIGIGSLVGVFTNNTFLALLCGAFSSYFLQLVCLPILSVGQNIAARHAALQAEEQYLATLKTEHDSAQLVEHLHAQDTLALQDSERLAQIDARLAQQEEVLYLLLEHLGIEAKLTTAGSLPIVRVGGHKTHIDEDQLIANLARAGIKPEILGGLPLDLLLALDRARPHSEESRHDREL